jgi:peptidoglycan/LPS O-acetylase OafA/YrhL
MRSDSSNLDILRSLAVLFVVVSHLPIPYLSSSTNYHFQALGLIGVLIFFVHTCLVLMLSLQRQTAKEGARNRACFFLVRRVFRIYPLSIVTVGLLSTVTYYSAGSVNLRAIVSNLLLIQNITGDPSNPGALWSLPYEVQMYLLLPALYVIVSRSKSAASVYIGVLWCATAGFTLLLWKLGMNYHLVKYIPCFLPGVLAFTLRDSDRSMKPWLLFVYVVLLAIFFPMAVAIGVKENLLAWPVCLVLGLIIPRCSEVRTEWLKFVGKLIAKYSFGIYLAHGPCIDFAFNSFSGAPQTLQWLIFISTTTGFSYLAYHVVESPCVEFGRRVAHRRLNTSAGMYAAGHAKPYVFESRR